MTILIKNVKILGGTEQFSEPRDVFITGDKISAIGNFTNKSADEVIDGKGAYLSPGFIDVDTDSDHYLTLFSYPQQDDFLKQGVTTIIGGVCGSSLAPLLYGSLESLQKWGDIRKVNVNWHSVWELLAAFDKKTLGVNFGTLVGHSTIRRAIVGSEIRDLTKKELDVFGGTLRRSLAEGGMGLSTGLGYVHSFRTPYGELKYLAQIVKEYDGVYATHIRKNGSELSESIEETMRLAKESGVKTLISHFMPLLGAENEYDAALKKIESLPRDADFHFDVYPYDTSILALYTFLPAWVQSGGREVLLGNLRDSWMRPRIEKDIMPISPENFVVAQAPGNEYLVGKDLKELGEMFQVPDYRSALIKLMLTTELRSTIFFKNISSHFWNRMFSSPRSLIASNAASFSEGDMRALKAERAKSTFTKFLSMSELENLMPLEDAVRKITLEPAKKFNLKGRGAVKEGNYADLTIFSFVDADFKKETRIKQVIVNGTVAVKDELATGKLAGRALKRGE